MPEIVIDDFRGGRNSLEAQDQIGPNQHSSGQDMWAEVRNLVTRRGKQYNLMSGQFASGVGQTAADSIIIYDDGAGGPTSIGKPYVPHQMFVTKQAASSLSRMVLLATYAGTAGRMPATAILFSDSITGGQTNVAATAVGYGVGTASASGTTVTGVGTAFTTNVKAGDLFKHNGSATLFTVDSVTNDTSLELTASAGTLSAGVYVIAKQIDLTRPAGLALFDVSSVQNLIISDGVNTPMRYDGTNVYDIAAMPVRRKILVHKNYVFAFDDTTARWSAIRDVTTWPAANSQTITNLGDPIRGAVVYGDHVVVFTTHRMFRLLGDVFDPSNPTYRLEEIGVPSDFTFSFARTAVIHQGVLKFLALDGWYGYIGGEGITKISKQIQTDVDAFLRIGSQEEARVNSAVAIVYKDRMLCSVRTTSGVAGRTWMQDEHGAWWNWNRGFQDFAIVQYGSTGSWLLQAVQGYRLTQVTGETPMDAFVHTLDIGTVENQLGGTEPGRAADFVTKEFMFDADVEFLDGEIETKSPAESATLTFGISIDRRTYISKTLNQDDTLGVAPPSGAIVRRHFYIGRIGKSIRFRMQPANPTNANSEIRAIRFRYRDSRGRRA